MDESQALNAFGALSEATRLRMLRYLVAQGDKGASAGEVAEAVGASSSRSSFHLATLFRAGLLRSEKQARQVIYRADYDNLGALAAFLLEDCCAGHPQVLACCRGAGAPSR